MIKIKKSQVILETVVAFVCICLFLVGIINIWVWANAQIVRRQDKYENTRLAAGTEGSGYISWSDPKPLEEDLIISNSFN